ncbi:MAG: DUF1517 domain-containing protein [Coleofasciculaceae cyanobacterium RL_1_1]|nr:DUF1517 domain-containing protein [Coleofasciculaceae cyanobacterium RL_1_1]
MSTLGDRFNRMTGKTRFVVCRIVVSLRGAEITPLLGTLNRAARIAIDSEGDLEVMGEQLDTIANQLIDLQPYWQSACNEGDVFWDEGEAGDYVNELFADSAQRYQGNVDLGNTSDTDTTDDPLTLPVTENVLVSLTIATEGEVPAIETDLADLDALTDGLKALSTLHYQERLRAVQVHFAPAKFGDRLTDEQLLSNYPELIPL